MTTHQDLDRLIDIVRGTAEQTFGLVDLAITRFPQYRMQILDAFEETIEAAIRQRRQAEKVLPRVPEV